MSDTLETSRRLAKAFIIDPVTYGIDTGGFPIAQIESSVFEGNVGQQKVVFKHYDRQILHPRTHKVVVLGLPNIFRYQEVTRRTATILNGCTVDFGTDTFTWDVVPIDKVGVSPRGFVCSVSQFIEGAELTRYINLEPQPGGKIDVNIFSDYGWDGVVRKLEEVSNNLQRETGIASIDLHPLNIKPDFGNRKLIITDVCSAVVTVLDESDVA